MRSQNLVGPVAAAVFRWVRSWRLLVRRLFALASVWGLVFSVAGLWNSDCVALRARKTITIQNALTTPYTTSEKLSNTLVGGGLRAELRWAGDQLLHVQQRVPHHPPHAQPHSLVPVPEAARVTEDCFDKTDRPTCQIDQIWWVLQN